MITNRRIQISVVCLISFLSFHLLLSQDVPKEGLKSITPQDMKAHVYFMASDGMKGRNTPSPELDSCAAYIAGEFKSYGLEGVGSEKSYYQTMVLEIEYSRGKGLELNSGFSLEIFSLFYPKGDTSSF